MDLITIFHMISMDFTKLHIIRTPITNREMLAYVHIEKFVCLS